MRDRAEKIAGLLIVMAMLPFLLLFSLGQCLADRFPPRRPRLRKAGVLGVAALCMLLVVGTLPVAGCSPATAAQDIPLAMDLYRQMLELSTPMQMQSALRATVQRMNKGQTL